MVCVYSISMILLITIFSMYPKQGLYTVTDVSQYSLNATRNILSVNVRLSDGHGFQVGDTIRIKGDFNKITNNDFTSQFNLKRYYNSQKIYYSTNVTSITIVTRFNNESTASFLLSLVSNELHPYYEWFFSGESNPELRQERQILSKLSIIHIFVISGFHITLISKWLNKYIKNDNIIIGVLMAILIWLDFSISVFRAILYYILLSKLERYRLSKRIILSYVAIILMSINPMMTLSMGFRLSVGITYFLIYLNQKVKNKYHAFILFQLFILSIIIFMQYELSILYFILPIIVTPIYLFLISLMIVNLLLPIDMLVLYLIEAFFSILAAIELNTPFLLFGKPSLIWMSLYILSIYLCIESRRKQYFMLVLCLLFYKYTVSSLFGYVTYINVGQGDSILIKPPLTNQAILIDTGGARHKDIAVDNLIPYFKRENIKAIETVLISHDDFDHSGALDSLLDNYSVNQVILPHTESFFFKNGSLVRLSTTVPYSSDNNDNSSIFIYNSVGSSFLFTGDATAIVEQSLYQNESMFTIDYLKVAHHGSNTSTTDLFLRQTNPSYAIISVGHNHYGHPHPAVIRRLQLHQVNILTTKYEGTIKVVPLPFYDLIFTNNRIIINRKN